MTIKHSCRWMAELIEWLERPPMSWVNFFDHRELLEEAKRQKRTGTPQICNEDYNSASAGIWDSLATWEDAKETRWVLTPIWGEKHSTFTTPVEHGDLEGAIVAFKLEEEAS